MEDFKKRLDIPTSYQMNDITKRVLKPIIQELSFIFSNLRINKIKAKKGRKIEWLEFTFTPEKRIHSKRQAQGHNKDNTFKKRNRELKTKRIKNRQKKKKKKIKNNKHKKKIKITQ